MVFNPLIIIEAIKNNTQLNTQKKDSKFIGIVNYYINMWSKRSRNLDPLTKSTPIEVKFKSTKVEK